MERLGPLVCMGGLPVSPSLQQGASMCSRAASGFTLLELLIVITFFGLVTAMTVPTVSRITTHSRVNQAALVVGQDLSQALSAAARQRKPIRIARGADQKS